MLKHIRRWLGWEDPAADFEPSAARATLPTPPARGVTPAPGSHPTARPQSPRADSNSEGQRSSPASPNGEASGTKLGLHLDVPCEVSFDPYNTGAFDRSRSWEKISKQRKR
jgi:hypothetical protein